MISPFRINVLDTSDNIIGSGPLPNVTKLSDQVSLDEIGEASFSLPAGQPESALIQPGVKFDIFDPLHDGYLGRFHYSSRTMKGKVLDIRCHDALVELTRDTAGFRRTFNNVPVTTALSTLAGLVGWTVNVEDEFNTTHTILSLEGESPLRGIDELRDRFGHFRLAGANTLDFGKFGQSAGVRITNLPGQIQHDLDVATEVAIIEDDAVTLVEEADEIWNSIIPLGTGQGEGVQLTIQQAAGGDYAVQSRPNADGSLMYYIQDADSVAAHDARWRILTFPQIRPLDNSTTAVARAALALKLTAETFMKKHLHPRLSLNLGDVQYLRQPVKVGDLVHLVFKGVVDGYGYVSLNEQVWVMEIRRNRTAAGRTISLTVANTDQKRTGDTDVILGIQRDIRAMKVHVPTTPNKDTVVFDAGVDAGGEGAAAVTDPFEVVIGNETQSLLKSLLRFKSYPLISPMRGVDGGGGSTATSTDGGDVDTTGEGGGAVVNADTTTEASTIEVEDLMPDDGASIIPVGLVLTGGASARLGYNTGGTGIDLTVNTGTVPASSNHVHKFTLDPHEHPLKLDPHKHQIGIDPHTHPPEFGFFADNVYPGQIGLKINGTDQTNQLGGPWGQTSGSSEVEVSVTDILNGVPGGVRRRHVFEFYCLEGRGRIRGQVINVDSIQAISAF